jgi:hypothetical protein
MKIAPWIVSGLGLVIIWPFAGMMTAFSYDAPTVPLYFEIIRRLLGLTLFAIPLVWIVALVLFIIEARRKKRPEVLARFAWSPYIAAGAHLLVWLAAFAAME